MAGCRPVLLAPGSVDVARGVAVRIPIRTGNNTGAAITVAAAGLPAGLAVESGGGAIAGTVQSGVALGAHQVTVSAMDTGGMVTHDLVVTVHPAVSVPSGTILVYPGRMGRLTGPAQPRLGLMKAVHESLPRLDMGVLGGPSAAPALQVEAVNARTTPATLALGVLAGPTASPTIALEKVTNTMPGGADAPA